MWTRIANFILRYRLFLLILLTVITGFMWYAGRNVKITTKLAELIPKHEKEHFIFKDFKEDFGQDANAMIVGMQDSSLYNNVAVFNDYYTLCEDIAKVEGLEKVLAIPFIDEIQANKRRRIFTTQRIFNGHVKTKEVLTQKINQVRNIKLYEGQLFNSATGASNIYIPFQKIYMDSSSRESMVWEIVDLVEIFGKKLFLVLSLLITALILYVFFRSITSVIFPLLVIASVVIWSKGTIGLLGYEITSLTGLIPTILVVIGIPNSVYLINKYHQEFAQHGNKIKALTNVIKKIGIVTLITNFTTAIGFLVLTSADITILKEFGVVAGINVFSTFFISIILIPVMFSYLPKPSTKQLKHLDFGLVNGVLSKINNLVQNYRTQVYIVSIVIVFIASYGVWLVKAVSFMTGDMADNNPTKMSLAFFEKNYDGTMPLEIIIQTGDSTWYKHEENIARISEFEDFLEKQEVLSKPLSIVQITKGLRQAYYNGLPQHYSTPSGREIKAIGELLVRTHKKAKKKGKTTSISFGGFNDKSKTGQIRISVKCADIGSIELNKLIKDKIIPKANELFEDVRIKNRKARSYPVQVTGTSYLFLQGNGYLIQNLKESLFLAIALIAVIMAFLFRSVRMIIISLVPNIIPLIVTAAIMGYFNVPLKPSTALIFSISFGISIDDSIHFLAKYRQELYVTNFNVRKAISLAIKETGASMIYTSIILFFGFIIFSFSDSKSVTMLGVLTSATLLMAMITNLTLLPTLLVTFDKVSKKKLKKD